MELLNIPKEELLEKLKVIKDNGWVHTNRSKNDGAVGNTLEDLLEIPENNLAIATGTIIENVSTGLGNDVITDNEVDNMYPLLSVTLNPDLADHPV